VANERAIASSGKKACVNERAEDRLAGGLIEPPKPLGLLRRQSQPRHFEKLSANSSNDLLNPSTLWHRSPRLPWRVLNDDSHTMPAGAEGNGPELPTESKRRATIPSHEVSASAAFLTCAQMGHS
jgi:hypothetical protein